MAAHWSTAPQSSPRLVKLHVTEAFSSDPRRSLVAVRDLGRSDLPWLERRAVLLARREGRSWGEIGRALHRSRQAVRQRYVAEDGSSPPLPILPDDEARAMVHWYRAVARDRHRDAFDSSEPDSVVPW